jgi:hypothetical protein
MGNTKYLLLSLTLIAMLTSTVQAFDTDITVKTDVPYYQVAVRLINYVNEDVIGSAYMMTDATGVAYGNISIEQDVVKVSVLLYRDGVIFKQFDNYGTFRTSSPINIDVRETKNETTKNETNTTATSTTTAETNETKNETTTTAEENTSITGKVTAPASSTITKGVTNFWIYIVAGLVIVGAAGFAGFKYVQQKGTLSGLSNYDKAKGPIEEKPLFSSNFQPVSEKMDSIATQRELQSAKDRIKNLERELTQAKNADRIREMEKKLDEDKKRLERLRRGENV